MSQVDGEDIDLGLWDTAGQEDYDRLRPLSYPDTDVVLMVFSVDNRTSLDNIREKWVGEVRHFCPTAPIVLVGNKTDLRMDTATLERLDRAREEVVGEDEGEKMADKIKAVAYRECSAKTREGVREVFETAVRATGVVGGVQGKKKRRCLLL